MSQNLNFSDSKSSELNEGVEITEGNLFKLIDSWLDSGEKHKGTEKRRYYFRGEKALKDDDIDYPLQPSLVRPSILQAIS